MVGVIALLCLNNGRLPGCPIVETNLQVRANAREAQESGRCQWRGKFNKASSGWTNIPPIAPENGEWYGRGYAEIVPMVGRG